MSVRLDSTTYHYTVKAPTPQETGGPREWPDLKRECTKHVVFRPDNLSFDVHVTASGHVSVKATVSGQRVLKEGLSEHRLSERYYRLDVAPDFVRRIVGPVLEWVKSCRSARHGTGQALPRDILGVPCERPEHRACRRQS